MTKSKKLKKNKNTSLILVVFFFIYLLLPGIQVNANLTEGIDVSLNKPAVIHSEVLATLSGREPVEAIILLKERPDTARIATAVKQYIRPYISREQEKTHIRQAVVNSLKETAARTQKSLLTYLENQKTKGLVSEYHDYYIVNAIYIKAMPRTIEALAKNPLVDKILPNTEYKLQAEEENIISPSEDISIIELSSSTAEWGIKKIGADRVWDEYNITGEGVVIGIIDTGVNWQHPALKEKFRGYDPVNPNNPDPIYNWYDAVYSSNILPKDSNSGTHGTHITGTAVGSAGTNLIGVAPGAQWIAANIFTSAESTDNNTIIRAGEYMLAPTDADGIPNPDKAPDIINCSWGAQMTGNKSSDEVLRKMVHNWRAAGILPVMAACNYGPNSGTIGMPAIYPESFAVAATDSNNAIYSKSSRGPVSYYPDEIKPNISAPGVSIRSAYGTSSYRTKDGTSMASPHIAGVAALMLSLKPELTVDLIEEIITGTTTPMPNANSLPNSTFGYGLANAFKAINEIYATYYDIIFFSDPALEEIVRDLINKSEGLVLKEDMEGITLFDAKNRGIVNLTGLEYAINLEVIDLSGNKLDNISQLENLLKINNLNLSNNNITNIAPLKANSIKGGLGQGDQVDLTQNKLYLDLEGQASEVIAFLKSKGVNVLYDQQVLLKVFRPDWEGPGIIKWQGVENAVGYELVLYMNDVSVEIVQVETDVNQYDFSEEMSANGEGSYTVTVQAKGDGQLFYDSELSGYSSVYKLIRLEQVSKPSWNNRVVYWDPVEYEVEYSIKLYKNDVNIVEATSITGASSWDFSKIINSQPEDGIYKATVQAKGDKVIFLEGLPSDYSDSYVPVQSISPDEETSFLLIAGKDSLDLGALVIIAPAEATNKNVVWSSDNDEIVSVSVSGVVSSSGTGSVIITATAEDGGFSVTYFIDSIKYGDISGSSSIAVTDAILILRRIVGIEFFTEVQEMAADVDDDSRITIADAIMVLRFIVGLMPDGFPVEGSY